MLHSISFFARAYFWADGQLSIIIFEIISIFKLLIHRPGQCAQKARKRDCRSLGRRKNRKKKNSNKLNELTEIEEKLETKN